MNGIYRGRNLGTISSLNEYLAFRIAHGLDTKEYKDIYIGDYVTIQDGTYNGTWVVADFDYYYRKGETFASSAPKGIVLMAMQTTMDVKLKNNDSTEGAYVATNAYITYCPAVASSLQQILGSYLQNISCRLSNQTNNNIISMAGSGAYGASSAYAWYKVQCVIPSEVQIFGSMINSSSQFDVGESSTQLALFKFVNSVTLGTNRENYWLRAVTSTNQYNIHSMYGLSSFTFPTFSAGIKPLIYIG